ncbi:YoaK family protein [Nonomuraea sp. NPDC050556]|uniref:YoaK family protein n=1 Tax=Nonomuraea sp. NPDC050556 TaxID=3364369 RepID=UPI003798D11B
MRNRVSVLSLALTSGAVDAFTFVALGHVFTSNMTGNLVLLGISVGHGHISEALGSLVALAAFTCGLAAAFQYTGKDVGWTVRTRRALAVELLLLAALAVAWALAAPRVPLIATAAFAMGIQSAVTQRLHTPVGSTTFITGALTGAVSRFLTPDAGESHLPELLAVLLALAVGAAAATASLTLLPTASPVIALVAALVAMFWCRPGPRPPHRPAAGT